MVKLSTKTDPMVIVGTAVVLGCEACGKPLTSRSPGCLWVDDRELADSQARHRGVTQRVRERNEAEGRGLALWSGGDLLDLPRPVRWQVHHFTCDPAPDVGCYWIRCDRIDTVAKLLHWTSHLMRKRWIDHTDWATLIDRAAGGGLPPASLAVGTADDGELGEVSSVATHRREHVAVVEIGGRGV